MTFFSRPQGDPSIHPIQLDKLVKDLKLYEEQNASLMVKALLLDQLLSTSNAEAVSMVNFRKALRICTEKLASSQKAALELERLLQDIAPALSGGFSM